MRALDIASTGLTAQQTNVDTMSQNLANATTTGFKAEMAAFRSVPVRGDGASTRVVSLEATAGFDSLSGPIQPTGRALDVAMGQGRNALYLAAQGWQVTGVDIESGQVTVTMSEIVVQCAPDSCPWG